MRQRNKSCGFSQVEVVIVCICIFLMTIENSGNAVQMIWKLIRIIWVDIWPVKIDMAYFDRV